MHTLQVVTKHYLGQGDLDGSGVGSVELLSTAVEPRFASHLLWTTLSSFQYLRWPFHFLGLALVAWPWS